MVTTATSSAWPAAGLVIFFIAWFVFAVGTVAMMVVAIVGIVHWSKARDKELQYHQDLRIREMEHQLKMKGLEIELEKAKQKSV